MLTVLPRASYVQSIAVLAQYMDNGKADMTTVMHNVECMLCVMQFDIPDHLVVAPTSG